MDKDYVILKNQKLTLEDVNKKVAEVDSKEQDIDSMHEDAKARLDALFKMRNLTKPESKANLEAVEPQKIETYHEEDFDYKDIDYDTLFDEAFHSLEERGIDPVSITREDFLDEETLKRIDADVNIPLYKQPHLDKYDYMISACCGIIAGLIDSFFVGKPGIKPSEKGLLQGFTDKQADKMVGAFAKCIRKSDEKAYNKALAAANKLTNESSKKAALEAAKRLKPSKINDGNVASAIGYLQDRYKVNYDARYAKDLVNGQNLKMSPSNHHIVSLGHSPDIVGLFFSVLDQFTGKSSFISGGKVVRLEPVETSPGFKLVGGSFIAKLYCGVCNWFGHIMSDIAGSSGTRGHINGSRGAGVPIPLFELFQLCNFGSFKVGDETKNLAEVMVGAFEKGYDIRFAATMAIPVVLNEVLIRLCFAIKSRYYHKKTWKESIPIGDKPELQRMILIGQGCLCLVDLADAAIRSGGNAVEFMLHLNIVAWVRFSFQGYKQIKKAYDEDGLLDTKAINKNITDEWEKIYNEVVEDNRLETV